VCARGFPNHDMTFLTKYPPADDYENLVSLLYPEPLTYFFPCRSCCLPLTLTQAFSVLFLLSRRLVSTSSSYNRACEGVAAWHLYSSPFLFTHLLTHACSVSAFSIGGKQNFFLGNPGLRSHTHVWPS
jgi:hypothetical protein